MGSPDYMIHLIATYGYLAVGIRRATGSSFFVTVMEGKRLGLLRDLVPTATLIAVLLNPNYAGFEVQSRDIQGAANALGLKIHVLHASSEQAIHAAFTTLARMRANACWLAPTHSSTVDANNCDTGGPLRHSGDLRIARICRGRRFDELWNEHNRRLSSGRSLHRAHSQGRQFVSPVPLLAGKMRSAAATIGGALT